ncbi:MAG: transposase, partial [Thermotogae bacterium]|nr:transposase [Thermotogota bacterium]
MEKYLTLPGEIILQFLQDNEEGMRQILTWFLNPIMEYEAQFQAGATHYERTTTRKAHRNGYRKRTLKTRYGALELLKPQLRKFPFQTQVF